jgi:hypothetical protein
MMVTQFVKFFSSRRNETTSHCDDSVLVSTSSRGHLAYPVVAVVGKDHVAIGIDGQALRTAEACLCADSIEIHTSRASFSASECGHPCPMISMQENIQS